MTEENCSFVKLDTKISLDQPSKFCFYLNCWPDTHSSSLREINGHIRVGRKDRHIDIGRVLDVLFYLFFSGDRVPHSQDWLQTHYMVETGLEFHILLLPAKF